MVSEYTFTKDAGVGVGKGLDIVRGVMTRGVRGLSHLSNSISIDKFQVKSTEWKKSFRYLRDLHVLKSIKNQAKVVAPLVKYDIP